MSVDGYRLVEPLAQSARSVVSRAIRAADGAEVVIKAPRTAPAPADVVARYRHEYGVLRRLDGDAAPRVLALVTTQDGPALILEPVRDAAPLAAMRGRPLAELLRAFEAVAAALGRVHASGVVHKDIHPANILYAPATATATFVDFDASSYLRSEEAPDGPVHAIDGSLAYVSPEQTGRMNRGVDHRSDQYSLGVTFYELLTGALPFQADTPLELVHAHIAKTPQPAHERAPHVPEGLSAIVDKLLAKSADDRYQSIAGLVHDLQECARRLEATGTIAPFALATVDASDRLQLADKFYGREREIALLRETFERTLSSRAQALFVVGLSGVGKTSLVRESRKMIVVRGGYFAAGKFDQLKRNIPYSALIQALQDLMRQIAAEPEARVARWRRALLEALGPNGAVITAVVPEVEWIIGRPQPAPPLPAQEAQNRFLRVVESFLSVFTKEEHPLVLFFDDLQWADRSTLDLLLRVLGDPTTAHLLVIGGYRENEVGEGHAVHGMREALVREGVDARTLDLQPLALEHVTQLLADSLHATREHVAPLARIVHAKTAGNPFFVGQFLLCLEREGALRFDPATRAWTWDAAQVAQRAATDNVLDLVLGRLRSLPEATKEALTLAACVGNAFDLETLSIVRERSPDATARDLWPAVEEGLVVPLGSGYKAFHAPRPDATAPASGADTARYRFLHDRVQQAAYALLDPSQRARAHLRIGRLVAAAHAGGHDDALFDVVDHFAQAQELLTDPAERRTVAALAVQAGKRAKASIAYASAVRLFQLAHALLAVDAWESDYAFAFDVHRELAECEYLSGNRARADELYRIATTHARSGVDGADVYALQVAQYTIEAKTEEALQVGIRGVQRLGLRLSRRGGLPAVVLALARAKMRLRGKSADALAQLPEMTDPRALARLRLLVALAMPAYECGDVNFYGVVILEALNDVLKYGVNAEAGFIFAAYGVLSVALEDYEEASRAGRAAARVSERFPSPTSTRVDWVLAWFIRPWEAPLDPLVDVFRRCETRFLDAGDLIYASFSGICRAPVQYFMGRPLAEVTATCDETEALLTRHPDFSMGYANSNLANLCARLADASGDPSMSIVDPRYGTDDHLSPQLTPLNVVSYYGYKAMLAYLLDAPEEALGWARRIDAARDAVASSLTLTYHYVYYSLILAACIARQPLRQRMRSRRLLRRNERKIARIARASPITFAPIHDLLVAERLRVDARWDAAIARYDAAIAGAAKSGNVTFVALANELAGRACLQRGNATFAGVYLSRARDAYRQWGALRKVRLLEATFAEHVAPAQLAAGDGARTTATPLASIDLNAVMRASQALSREVALARLLDRMLEVVLEQAGAQRGVLLMESGGQLRVRAEGRVTGDRIEVTQPASDGAADAAEDAEANAIVQSAIVQYVARSGEVLVVEDASVDARFADDPYVKRARARSVFCLPLVQQGRSKGVLFLENALVAGAFTARHVDTLTLLATQLAISLENAEVYERLEARVAERTEALAVAHRSLRELFDHMRQAIVAFGLDGRVIGGTSRQATAVLGRGDLEGADVRALLFPDGDAAPLERAHFDEWLAAVAAVPVDALDELSSLAPSELVLHKGTPRETWLQIELRPIVTDGRVTRIMMLATDETERRRLERAVNEKDTAHARQLARMRRLFATGTQPFVDFLAASRARAARIEERVAATSRPLDAAAVESLFRDAHTMKGEATAFDLGDLERACAALEVELQGMRGELQRAAAPSATRPPTAPLRDAAAQVAAAVGRARDALVEASPIGRAVLEQITVARPDVERLDALARDRDDEIGDVARRLAARPFGEATASILQATPLWAEIAGKQVQLQVVGREVRIPAALGACLPAVLTHLVRNAIAHGIETADERHRAGKPAAGAIRVACVDEPHGTTIEVRDDGRGIDVARLAAEAHARGIAVTPGRETDLVFVDGLSTSPLNRLSGRGVGMAAARAQLASVGYALEVSTVAGAGTVVSIRRAGSARSLAPTRVAASGAPALGR